MTANIDRFRAHETRLLTWLRAKMPQATELTLDAPDVAGSGFSNETYFFRLAWKEDGQARADELVLRWTPEGAALFPDYDLGTQYHIMRCLQGTAVPVPKVLWLETNPAVLGQPFYLMERIHGAVASGHRPGFHGHGLFFDASIERRQKMWWNAVDTMIAVHRLDWRALGVGEYLGNPASGIAAIDYGIAQMERWLDWADMDPLPVLRAGLEWLRKNRYEPSRYVLCWGDVRPGNMIYRDEQVVAGLDWEHAMIGPPEFDLAYFILVDLITAEINQVPRLPGIPNGSETRAYYEEKTGQACENFFYAEVFEAVRMAVFLVLTVKASPKHLKMPADFATNNIPTRRIADLLGRRT